MSTAVPEQAPPIILVVDDDQGMRLMLRRMLEQAGYEVVEASSGEEGLSRYGLTRPDVVVLDVMMPGLNGFEVVPLLRAKEDMPWTPVLMLTALNDVADKVRGLEVGADDFLSKPCNRAELVARVRALLRLKQLHNELEHKNYELERKQYELEKSNALLHRALKRYVSPEIAEVVLASATKSLKLGGASYPVSVLFADIRHFTSFSERLSAYQVLTLLNRIWDALVPIIFEMHGTFDKYLGDGLMAFYGAPVPLEDDALRALLTAVAMQERFRQLRELMPELAEMGIGIGIASGEAVVGNVGSEQVMDYTVIGSTPNAAKRLEEIAVRDQILICENSYQAVRELIEVRALEPLVLQGIRHPLQAYEVLKLRPSGNAPSHKLWSKLARHTPHGS